MADFDLNDMGFALSEVDASEVGTEKPKPAQNFVGAPKDVEEANKKARDHKWVDKTEYDYSRYNVKDKNAPPSDLVDLPSWASNAVKYEWQDEWGDVGPRVAELEAQLFDLEFLHRKGHNYNKLELEVKAEGGVHINPIAKFSEAGLHPVMMETLQLMHYGAPTPVQAYCIPAVLTGHDVVASAQTGSGKTGAYLIPIISKLMGKAKKLCAKRPNPTTFNPKTDRVRAEPLVLIVAPTRELVCQIFDETRRLCYRSMLRPCVAYGGGPMGLQRQELEKGCDILISTPGRLIDFMGKPSLLSLKRLKYTVIDEADELLHGDWEENLTKIMSGGDGNEDPDHSFMMFSATFPKEFRKLARKYMEEDYYRISVGRIGSTHENIKQEIIWAEESRKRDALYDKLFSIPPARTMVFVNSKRQADLLDDFLFNKGLPSTSIHADRTQREREDAIFAFRYGQAPILVTTGIAARGIDIKNVKHVINFDLPTAEHGGIQEYINRIGRTGRIGHEGSATSFYNDRNEDIAEALVKILIETKHEVPEFLEEYKPIEGALEFSDNEELSSDSDDDSEVAGGDVGDDAWATSGGDIGGDGSFKPDGESGAPVVNDSW